MTERLLDGRSVLILEDEFLIAMDVEQICLDAGARDAVIVGAIDGAGDGLLERRFDAAILDLRLGGHSTLDFARLLMTRGVPFVFATGYSEPGELNQEFPGVAVVAKPYASDDLLQALAAAIAGRAS